MFRQGHYTEGHQVAAAANCFDRAMGIAVLVDAEGYMTGERMKTRSGNVATA